MNWIELICLRKYPFFIFSHNGSICDYMITCLLKTIVENVENLWQIIISRVRCSLDMILIYWHVEELIGPIQPKRIQWFPKRPNSKHAITIRHPVNSSRYGSDKFGFSKFKLSWHISLFCLICLSNLFIGLNCLSLVIRPKLKMHVY